MDGVAFRTVHGCSTQMEPALDSQAVRLQPRVLKQCRHGVPWRQMGAGSVSRNARLALFNPAGNTDFPPAGTGAFRVIQESIMENGSRKPYRPRRSSVEHEEDQIWIRFYRSAGDADSAAELIDYLGSDPELKRKHAALFLKCKQTVRKARQRQAKARRIGHFVRVALRTVLVTPFLALRSALRLGGDIAVECLPEAGADPAVEPAVRRVKKLARKPVFVQDELVFAKAGSDAAAPKADATGKSDSGRSKAA